MYNVYNAVYNNRPSYATRQLSPSTRFV